MPQTFSFSNSLEIQEIQPVCNQKVMHAFISFLHLFDDAIRLIWIALAPSIFLRSPGYEEDSSLFLMLLCGYLLLRDLF